MLKQVIGVTLAGLLMCSTAALAAHDEYRIIGTVAKITASQIDVKQTKDGKIIEIDVDKQTKVTRDKKPVAFGQIKVGGSVVVEALGDSILDLQALEIRLVPAIPSTQKPK
jgi:hypothetical protein